MRNQARSLNEVEHCTRRYCGSREPDLCGPGQASADADHSEGHERAHGDGVGRLTQGPRLPRRSALQDRQVDIAMSGFGSLAW